MERAVGEWRQRPPLVFVLEEDIWSTCCNIDDVIVIPVTFCIQLQKDKEFNFLIVDKINRCRMLMSQVCINRDGLSQVSLVNCN